MRTIALAVCLLGAAACTVAQADTHTAPPASQPPALSASEMRGLAFAHEHCAACHAVEANGTSPNPESPPFADIANRPGVTRETLAQFLRDSHNYPEAMNFRVEAERIRDLADYMLTLRQPGYQPSI